MKTFVALLLCSLLNPLFSPVLLTQVANVEQVALPGFAASCGLMPHLRAIANRGAGVEFYTFAPDSQFAVGVALT